MNLKCYYEIVRANSCVRKDQQNDFGRKVPKFSKIQREKEKLNRLYQQYVKVYSLTRMLQALGNWL